MTIIDPTFLEAVQGDVVEATVVLGEFIAGAARRTAEEVGFGYVIQTTAPNTYADLVSAVQESMRTGRALPISSENSDDIIYGSPRINADLRFWHDVNHVRRDLNFGLVDELELSLWHLSELEYAGHPPGSLVWRLLHADLTGQVYVQAFAQRFPGDQRRFVRGCVSGVFEHELLRELRRDGQR